MTDKREDAVRLIASLIRGSDLSRRRFLAGSGALGATAASVPLLGALGRPARAAESFEGETIVFTSWGGSYQDAQKACYCDPFSEKTGATVIQDGPMNNAKYRTMVESGAPIWDVVDVTIEFLYSGVPEGLFEKIDQSKIHVDRINPLYVHDYGIGDIVWSYNIGYNTKSFAEGEHPKSWADVFDVDRFPGRRTLRDRVTPMMEIALMADGVPPDELYPIDAERAFAKLDTIKENTVFWETNSQSQQLFIDGEVSCGVILNGRAYDAAMKGGDVAIEWNQNIQSVDYLVVPKGSRNYEVGLGLIDEMTLAENQAKLANMIAYSPTNPEAFSMIDPKIAPWLSTNPENAKQGFVINAEYWRDHLEDMAERWEAWKLS